MTTSGSFTSRSAIQRVDRRLGPWTALRDRCLQRVARAELPCPPLLHAGKEMPTCEAPRLDAGDKLGWCGPKASQQCRRCKRALLRIQPQHPGGLAHAFNHADCERMARCHEPCSARLRTPGRRPSAGTRAATATLARVSDIACLGCMQTACNLHAAAAQSSVV